MGSLWDNFWAGVPNNRVGEITPEMKDQFSQFEKDPWGLINETIAQGGLGNDEGFLQSKYDFKYLMFPNDLGMSDVGHYMVININVPITLDSARAPGSPAKPATDLYRAGVTGGPSVTTNYFFDFLDTELSKIDILRFQGGQFAPYGIVDKGGSINSSDSITSRRTRRIAESIALYMPGNQLRYITANEYINQDMTGLIGGVVTGAANLVGSYGAGLVGGTLGKIASWGTGAGDMITKGMETLGSTISTTAQLAGRPINPRVEVLFAKTGLREYEFEFVLSPRNADEAKTIYNIVRTMRFHAAPELDNYGMNFIAPAEFDITFFHNGIENTKIPRINTCVLNYFEADFAGPVNGNWATYEDGSPVVCRIQMKFTEVEPVHKLRVLQGF